MQNNKHINAFCWSIPLTYFYFFFLLVNVCFIRSSKNAIVHLEGCCHLCHGLIAIAPSNHGAPRCGGSKISRRVNRHHRAFVFPRIAQSRPALFCLRTKAVQTLLTRVVCCNSRDRLVPAACLKACFEAFQEIKYDRCVPFTIRASRLQPSELMT